MVYIVLNHNEEMIDVLTFESEEELLLYKSKNPNYILKEEDSINTIDNLFEIDDVDLDDLDEW